MKSIPFCRSVRTRKKWKEVAEIYKKQFNIRMRSAKNGVYLLAFELVVSSYDCLIFLPLAR